MRINDSKDITVRMARWSATHPWRAIVGWSLFVAVCLGVGLSVGTNQAAGRDFWIGEAGRAESIATQGDVMRPPVEKILISATGDGGWNAAEADRAAADVARRMSALPEVAAVAEPVRSADGSAVMVAVTMAGDVAQAKQHITPLLEQTAAAQAAHRGVAIKQTGEVSISKGVNDQLGSDLARAEAFTLPVTLLILFMVFGTLLAAGVPVLLALSSIAAAVGLYGLASYVFPDAGGAVVSVILMLGMAVGVDYSLFYLKRAREERERAGGRISHAAAVELAAVTSGRAIVVSGFAVIVSLVGLYLAHDVIFSSIATGSIIVVAVAMASSLTVLPALLAKLGHRVDGRRAVPHSPSTPADGVEMTAGRRARWWPALLRPAMRHPVATLLAGTAVMITLAIPALSMKLNVEGRETFPKSIPAVDAYDRLIAAFPAEGVAHMVAVRADGAGPGEIDAALRRLAAAAERDPLFTGTAVTRISTDGRIGVLDLAIAHPASSEQAEQSLRRLRTDLVPSTVGGIAGAAYAVSGEPARGLDYSAHQASRLPWVVGFVLLATFVMMTAAFGSIVIGLLGVLLNLLSAAAAWGALVIVFQGTWAEDILGFTSTGFIGSRIPLMVFAILFGLSMDYQIFVLSRIREGVKRGLPTRQAVFEGITGSASVVTSAAVVMVSVFVSFMLINRIEMKQVGLGLAVAVLLDAVIVRIMILPAALTLLGRASWWPARPAELAQPGAQAVS
ncbi:MMPL family transporter [Catellatospora sichuanensis]|uniref:MMPL family transporter n=1 Tax=Catellatospora sichuanensis TaxID=1969805 RepID=UPI001C907347|nr:MMPL family transporter [Catellatospora sichuanensis]